MQLEMYEERLLEGAKLLAQARSVADEKNMQAVNAMSNSLRLGGLKLTQLESRIGGRTQSVQYLESERTDESRMAQYVYGEEPGVSAEYELYPIKGQDEWNEEEKKRIELFVLMLYQANERQKLAADVDYYKYHDPQTRHTNMTFFSRCCEQYIINHTIGSYTAMAVNLSGFTNLNLEIGSSNCDTVLVTYMDWLKRGLDVDEVVSRISGDQFALLIHQEHEEQILDKLRGSEIYYGKQESDHVCISAEAGIYRLTDGVDSYHHIIQAVSSALNVAKSSLQLQFSYYDPMTADASERKKFYEAEFEKALVNEDIHVYFQPKVSLKDYDLIGAEALSRWIVDGKIVPPDSFIPILEETTRICELDFYVLEHVCKSIQRWIAHGVQPVKVSVNFSRRHLSNERPSRRFGRKTQIRHRSPLAGDKILRPLQNNADLFQAVKIDRPASSRLYNPSGRTNPDPRHPQKRFLRRAVDLDREKFGMGNRPVALRVKLRIKKRVRLIQNLSRRKAVKPQKPVRLIQPVLPQKRRANLFPGKKRVGIDRNVRREKDPFERILLIKSLGKMKDLVIGLGRSPDDHLGALPGRGKFRRVPVADDVPSVFGDPVPNLLHRRENRLPALVGRKHRKARGTRKLDVDAHPVGQHPQPLDQPRVGSRNRLGVNIAVKMMLKPQKLQHPDHLLTGIVRISENARRQKQSLDIVAAVKLHRKLGQFLRLKSGAGGIVAPAVDAVFAVVHTDIGHQHLQKRNAPPVRRKGVADSRRSRAPDPARQRCFINAGRSAGDIVFSRVG